MTRLDEAVRDALQDLSEQGRPPTDLGPTTFAAGRRLRHRRTALTGIAALAAAAVIAAPIVTINATRSTGDVKVGTPSPSASPTYTPPTPYVPPPKLVTVKGWTLAAGVSSYWPSFVYDRAKKKYVKLGYHNAIPNQAGTLALVTEKEDLSRAGLLDLRTGKVDWSTLNAGIKRPWPGYYAWSPDGRKVLIGTESGFAIFDLASRRLSPPIRVDFKKYAPAVTWHPSGNEVVLAAVAPDSPLIASDHQLGAVPFPTRKILRLQLLDLTGRPTRTVPVPGVVAGPTNWSPDGRYVVAAADFGKGGRPVYTPTVFDTKTGATVATLQSRQFSFPLDVWWLDNERILIEHLHHGTQIRTVDLTGKVLDQQNLPDFGEWYNPILYPPQP
jgi:hypothetical protein